MPGLPRLPGSPDRAVVRASHNPTHAEARRTPQEAAHQWRENEDGPCRPEETAVIASGLVDELKERLAAAYGARLHAVVLFGSEVRGDARPDSDIDVLAVLETLPGDYGDSPLLREVRRSGVAA